MRIKNYNEFINKDTPYKRILLIERITKSGGKREFMEALIRIKHLWGL